MTDLNPNYIWANTSGLSYSVEGISYPFYGTNITNPTNDFNAIKAPSPIEYLRRYLEKSISMSIEEQIKNIVLEKENIKMCDCPTCKAGFGDMPKYSIGTEYVEDLAHIFSENYVPDIKSLIFNPPFSTVLWDDDTTTVSKTMEGDEFDPMVGFSICVLNKIFDSKNEYKKLISESWNYYQVKQEKKNQKAAKRAAKKLPMPVIQK